MIESRVLGPKTGPERRAGYQTNFLPTMGMGIPRWFTVLRNSAVVLIAILWGAGGLGMESLAMLETQVQGTMLTNTVTCDCCAGNGAWEKALPHCLRSQC